MNLKETFIDDPIYFLFSHIKFFLPPFKLLLKTFRNIAPNPFEGEPDNHSNREDRPISQFKMALTHFKSKIPENMP